MTPDTTPAPGEAITHQHRERFKAGVRAAVTWLHARAAGMTDPVCRGHLDSAATNLGWDLARDQNDIEAVYLTGEQRAEKAERWSRLQAEDIMTLGQQVGAAEQRAAAAEARVKVLEEAFDRAWRRAIGYRFAQVCKHLVAGNMLSDMEQLGFVIPRDLAHAVVTCDDETALGWPALAAQDAKEDGRG